MTIHSPQLFTMQNSKKQYEIVELKRNWDIIADIVEESIYNKMSQRAIDEVENAIKIVNRYIYKQ